MRFTPAVVRFESWSLIALALVAFGCHPKKSDPTTTDVTDAGVPFEAVTPLAAVSKVKDLLVGLPATDDEVAAVAADPTALKGLITQWQALPQYTANMQAFFGTAFQQSQALSSDYENQGTVPGQMVPGLNQSFAMTVIELISEGRPFTDVYTTQRFMLTPALMVQYAFLDESTINDKGQGADAILKATDGGFTFTIEADAGAITLAETLDPANKNYMVWNDSGLTTSYDPLCPISPIVYTTQKHQQSIVMSLFEFLVGTPGTFVVPSATEANGVHNCRPPAVPKNTAYLTASDYTTWSMVTIRKPNPGEATTAFYDLATIRSATELVLNTPRVGYFTTPSFLAQWQTNASNQARVTLNQTMITGLGKEIDYTNVSTPPSEAAEDSVHAVPGSPCYGCHLALDPMRQFFRQDYSLYFSPQTDPTQMALTPSFGFLGVSQPGNSITDLGTLLQTHPRVAAAWTQKLCTWANSGPCAEDDPLFIQIAADFASSDFNWNTLVAELMSSPMVTYLSPTATVAENGEVFPIARQQHLCTLISNRLNVTDACGLLSTTAVPSRLRVAQTIAASLPSDAYGRGAELPILANNPSLTYRAGLENLCAAVANQVIDNGSTSLYSSGKSFAAMNDFVHNLMGIPPSQDSVPLSILQGHFNNAETAGATPTVALQSTFVVACLSPAVAGVGL